MELEELSRLAADLATQLETEGHPRAADAGAIAESLEQHILHGGDYP